MLQLRVLFWLNASLAEMLEDGEDRKNILLPRFRRKNKFMWLVAICTLWRCRHGMYFLIQEKFITLDACDNNVFYLKEADAYLYINENILHQTLYFSSLKVSTNCVIMKTRHEYFDILFIFLWMLQYKIVCVLVMVGKFYFIVILLIR